MKLEEICKGSILVLMLVAGMACEGPDNDPCEREGRYDDEICDTDCIHYDPACDNYQPPAPTQFLVESKPGWLLLTWAKVPDAESYTLRRDPNAGTDIRTLTPTQVGDPPTFEDREMEAGWCFTYYLQAHVRGFASETVTAEGCAGTTSEKDPPVLSGQTVDHTTIDLSWTAVADATNYLIYKSDQGSQAPNDSFLQIAETAATTYRDSNAYIGDYSYYVVAMESTFVETLPSNIVDLTTEAPPLAAPTLSLEYDPKTGIKLSWTAVDGADGYYVLRSTEPDSNFSMLTMIESGLSHLDNMAGFGMTYYYHVTAFNQLTSQGEPSNTVNVTTVPSFVLNLKINAIDYDSVSLTWDALSYATSYKIYRDPSANQETMEFVASSSTNSYSHPFSTLQAGEQTWFMVTAVAEGGESLDAAAIFVSRPFALPTPTGFVASMTKLDVVEMSWDAVVGADHYIVYRSGVDVSGQIGTTAFADATPSLETYYQYSVRAFTAALAPSDAANATGRALRIAAPASIQITVSVAQLEISWSESDPQTAGYRLYRSETTAGPYAMVKDDIQALSVVDVPPSAGVLYYYKVAALSPLGNESELSTLVGGQINDPVAHPANQSASDGEIGEIVVSWESVPGADFYRVNRSLNPDSGYSVVSDDLSSPVFVDTTITPDVDYYYRVYAHQDDGDVSLDRGLWTKGWAEWPDQYSLGIEVDGADAGIGAFDTPLRIAVDSNCQLHVAEPGTSSLFGIYRFLSDGTFVDRIGTWGYADGEFNAPFAIAVDASSTMYVADTHVQSDASYHDRIQEISSAGNYVRHFAGSRGSGNGQLSDPREVVVTDSGDVFVLDYNNNRIVEFDNTTAWVMNIPIPTQAEDFAVDSSLKIYVPDPANDQILVFDADGNPHQPPSFAVPAGTSPKALAIGPIDSQGNGEVLFVGDGVSAGDIYDRVRLFDLDGNLIKTMGRGAMFTAIRDIAVCATGFVWVLDSSNWIYRLDPAN